MKFRNLLTLLAALPIVVFMSGCHSDIDLEDIDTRAEIEMGVALPIGSVHATLGDFIGQIDHVYIDSMGVITWKDTFVVSRDYHQLDLATYIPNAHLSLNVYDKLEVYQQIGDNRRVTGLGIPTTLDFPLTVKLNGINNPDSLDKERLDSALIEVASFASVIRTQNGLPLKWEWVDSVTLSLGERVHRPAGNRMVVYDKTNPIISGYGQRAETNVDNFGIDFMKNHPGANAALIEYLNNVVDSVEFEVHFTFTIPAGEVVEVPKNAGFDYQLDIQFLTYKAIWGMFEPSNEMHDEAVVDLADSWGDLEFLTKSSFPFSNPKVLVDITTQIAGALRIKDAYIYSVDMEDVRHPAAFGATESETRNIDFQPNQWLPLSSEIGDSTTNMTIEFDKTPDGGRIDRLFQGIPKELGYKFDVEFNQQTTPQIRITPNTAIRVNAIATLPLMFNEGLQIEYSDTIKDVNLSAYTLDSLLKEVEVIDSLEASELKLYIAAKNEIPLDIYASMRCYNERHELLMDPEDNSKPLLLFLQDTVTFVAPSYEFSKGQWNMVNAGETVITADLTQEKLDMLPQISYITYTARIDDNSLKYAFDRGYFNIQLTGDAGLTLKIGVTAKTDAYLHFDLNK